NLNKKIKWVVQANVANINEDILKMISEAGCIKIELGIESLKDINLISVNKKPVSHLNEKCLMLCKKNNIKVHTYFMFGFKDEKKSDLDNLLGWIKKYRPHTFNLNFIKVYPGTVLYENQGNNFFEENSWTRNNINDYFKKKEINTIDDKEIIKWFREIFYPFYKNNEIKAALQVNSLKTLIKMAYLKYFRN
ncbi:MAG: hypothetical protein PHU65_08145, partial [Actinomycetota bacterium]|nr:hypothetical protein [Actinomycetota bacterium]